MNKFKVTLVILVGVILLTAFTSTSIAASNTIEFTINNQTSRTLEFTFLGEETHVITAPPGKTRFDITKATYQLSYYDCGKLNITTIKITNKNNELKVTGCATDAGGSTGGVLNTVQFVINNKSGKTLEISLLGEQNYFVTAVPGKNRLEILKGTFQMSYYDCGQLNISNITIKREDTQVKILNCSQTAAGAEPTTSGGEITLGTKVPQGSVVFVISNKTDRATTFSLIGAEVQSINALLGRTKVVVPKGVYGYAYFACGNLWTGTVTIRKTGDEIILTSCHGGQSGRPNEGNNITFRLKNNTGKKFYINLEGPQDYSYFVKAKNSGLYEVEKGFYTYTYTVCDITFSGTVFLKNGFTFKTPFCKGR